MPIITHTMKKISLSKSGAVKKVARNLKAVVFDADGVMFSGQVLIGVGPDGVYKEMLKTRSHIDGQGMSLLRAAGIRIAIITAEATGFVEALADKLNNLPSVKSGAWPKIDAFTGPIGKDKASTLEKWLADLGMSWSECAYMGDDLGDFQVMQKVGLPAAAAQAEDQIKSISSFVSKRPGGAGAVRDLCNFILDAKGIDATKLLLR